MKGLLEEAELSCWTLYNQIYWRQVHAGIWTVFPCFVQNALYRYSTLRLICQRRMNWLHPRVDSLTTEFVCVSCRSFNIPDTYHRSFYSSVHHSPLRYSTSQVVPCSQFLSLSLSTSTLFFLSETTFRPGLPWSSSGLWQKKVCWCWGRGIGNIMTTQQERTCSCTINIKSNLPLFSRVDKGMLCTFFFFFFFCGSQHPLGRSRTEELLIFLILWVLAGPC